MADGITITSTGLDATVRGLAGLANADRRKLFQRLGDHEKDLTYERMKRRLGNTDRSYPPSKRAQREGGDTLWDKGHMITAFGPQGVTENKVTMAFGSQIEGKKAFWNQHGTRAFTVRKGKAFPIKAGGSERILAWSRKKAATPPRPLFGVSPKDATSLMEHIRDFYRRAAEKAGMKIG